MSMTEDQCAAMAANMLDDELLAITRRLATGQQMTPLQRAVAAEWQLRQRSDRQKAL